MDEMERLRIIASYTLADGRAGTVEFVARIRDASHGTNAIVRARRAVARRMAVPQASVTITGVMTC